MMCLRSFGLSGEGSDIFPMIGIAGAGGIGSNVALNLVRAGCNRFTIADFDTVDESNLNRQFYFRSQLGKVKVDMLEKNLSSIMPDLNIIKHPVRLTPDNVHNVFSGCDIIVEGFDGAEDKVMLIQAFASTGKLIVSASGLAGLKIDNIEVKNAGKNVYIVGDFSSDISTTALFSPKIQIVTAIMSNIILQNIGFSDKK